MRILHAQTPNSTSCNSQLAHPSPAPRAMLATSQAAQVQTNAKQQSHNLSSFTGCSLTHLHLVSH
jgi:hypothetical protein